MSSARGAGPTYVSGTGAGVALDADPGLSHKREPAWRAVADVGYVGGIDDRDVCGLNNGEWEDVHSTKVADSGACVGICAVLIGPP